LGSNKAIVGQDDFFFSDRFSTAYAPLMHRISTHCMIQILCIYAILRRALTATGGLLLFWRAQVKLQALFTLPSL
jgi:hypothetical protein